MAFIAPQLRNQAAVAQTQQASVAQTETREREREQFAWLNIGFLNEDGSFSSVVGIPWESLLRAAAKSASVKLDVDDIEQALLAIEPGTAELSQLVVQLRRVEDGTSTKLAQRTPRKVV